MERLKFIETMSIADFKAKKGVERIEVKQNPQSGKCFIVFGIETGAVSDKFNKGLLTDPVISKVVSPEDGEMFFMFHQRGEGGAHVLAVL